MSRVLAAPDARSVREREAGDCNGRRSRGASKGESSGNKEEFEGRHKEEDDKTGEEESSQTGEEEGSEEKGAQEGPQETSTRRHDDLIAALVR